MIAPLNIPFHQWRLSRRTLIILGLGHLVVKLCGGLRVQTPVADAAERSETVPELNWVTASSGNTPGFTIDLLNPRIYDTITLRWSAIDNFSTVAGFETIIIGVMETSSLQVYLSGVSLADGVWYFQARHNLSEWCAPLIVTIDHSLPDAQSHAEGDIDTMAAPSGIFTNEAHLGFLHRGPRTEVHVKEICIALPDMLMVRVRDQEVVTYAPVVLGSPDVGALGTRNLRTNPNTGASEYAEVISADKMYLKFADKYPTAFADRTILDDASKWGTIGGQTVTAVYRKSTPYDQCNGFTENSGNTAVFEHECFLQLSGNLPAGGPYTIACSGAGFTNTTFTHQVNNTRAVAIHASQVGYRPTDTYKHAIFSLWIPGYGMEGRMDLSSLLGSSSFQVVNQLNAIVYSGTFLQMVAPTEITQIMASEKSVAVASAVAETGVLTVGAGLVTGDYICVLVSTGTAGITSGTSYFVNMASSTTCTLHPTGADAYAGTKKVDITATFTGKLCRYYNYPSSTGTSVVITGASRANPGIFTKTSHGLSIGDLVYPMRIAGMRELEGKDCRVCGTNFTTNQFSVEWDSTGAGAWIPLDTTAFTTWSNTGIFPAHNNEFVRGFYANNSATYSYLADFSSVTTAGMYRIRIPGLGVSDPFRIHAGVYHTALKTAVKGVYNQITGYALSRYIGGVERPIMAYDGTNQYNIIYESLMPAVFSNEGGIGALNSGDAINTSTWARAETTMGTVTRATGFHGGWSDAGDMDWHIGRHGEAMYLMLEHGWRQLPSGSRNVKAGFPNLTSLLDATTYAGTDNLGDQFGMVLVYMDCLRVFQKSDGRVYSGMAYGGTSANGGIHQSTSEPTYLANSPYALHAADPTGNFVYAAVAAKLSQCFTDAGFTTLAATWKASSELAYAWADALMTDYDTKGATGSAVQDYFVTKLNMKVNAGWSDPTFAMMMLRILGSGGGYGVSCRFQKKWAAACLMAISGGSSIYATYLNSFAYASLNEASGASEKFAVWEYSNMAVPPARQADKDYYASRQISVVAYGQNTNRVNSTGPALYTTNPNLDFGNSVHLSPAGPRWSSLQALAREAPADPPTSIWHKQMQTGMAYMFGANQQGLCTMIGLGARNPVILHRDRESMGLKTSDWPGLVCYTWWNSNNTGLAFANYANGDSSSNFIITMSESTYPYKVLEPPLISRPPTEGHIGNTFDIYRSEFVTEDQVYGTIVGLLKLHAFDGNTAVEIPYGYTRYMAVRA